MSQRCHEERMRWFGNEPQRHRARERREMRFCPARLYTLHPADDQLGKHCAACAEKLAEAHARCEALHPTAPTYGDGRGVLRYHCCYRRVDGEAG